MAAVTLDRISEAELGNRILNYLRARAETPAIDSGNSSIPVPLLDDAAQAIVRTVLAEHDALHMRSLRSGNMHTMIVRLVMRVRDDLQRRYENGWTSIKGLLYVANGIAYGFRALPRIVRPRVSQILLMLYPGDNSVRRLRARIYRSGYPISALLDIVREVPQHVHSRAYVRDRARHSAVGVVVGFDLMRQGERWAVAEANTGIGQQDQWMLRNKENPFIENMFLFARQAGFHSLCVINNDRGLRGPQDEVYQAIATETGIRLTIIEPSSVPATKHPRSSVMPEHLDPGTLYVRIRCFNAWPDYVLSDKQQVQESLQDYISRHDVTDVFVPDTEPGWLERIDWDSGPYPNLVAKLPRTDSCVGVAFYKARDADDARALARSNNPGEFAAGGLHGKLERLVKRSRKVMQPFVRSDQFLDGRLAIFRTSVLATPFGSQLLSVTKYCAARPVPASLDCGVVRDPLPFLVNGSVGATRHLPEPSELSALEAVAKTLGSAMSTNLERHFVIEERE